MKQKKKITIALLIALIFTTNNVKAADSTINVQYQNESVKGFYTHGAIYDTSLGKKYVLYVGESLTYDGVTYYKDTSKPNHIISSNTDGSGNYCYNLSKQTCNGSVWWLSGYKATDTKTKDYSKTYGTKKIDLNTSACNGGVSACNADTNCKVKKNACTASQSFTYYNKGAWYQNKTSTSLSSCQSKKKNISWFSLTHDCTKHEDCSNSTIYKCASDVKMANRIEVAQEAFTYKYLSSTGQPVFCLDPGANPPSGDFTLDQNLSNEYNSKYIGIANILHASGADSWKSTQNATNIRQKYFNTQIAIWYYLGKKGASTTGALSSKFPGIYSAITSNGNLKNSGTAASIAQLYNSTTSNISTTQNTSIVKVGTTSVSNNLNANLKMNGDQYKSEPIYVEGVSNNAKIVITGISDEYKNKVGFCGKSGTEFNPANKSTFYVCVNDAETIPIEELKKLKVDLAITTHTESAIPKLLVYKPKTSGQQRIVMVDYSSGTNTVEYKFNISFKVNDNCEYNSTFSDMSCCNANWIEFYKNNGNLYGDNDADIMDEFYTAHPECAKCNADDFSYSETGSNACSEEGSTKGYKDSMSLNGACIHATEDKYSGTGSSYYNEVGLIPGYCTVRCVEDFSIKFPGSPTGLSSNTGYFVWPNTPLTYGYFGNKTLSATGTRNCRIMVNENNINNNLADDNAKTQKLKDCLNSLKNNYSSIYSMSPEFTLSYKYDAKFKTSINKDRSDIGLTKYSENITCNNGSANCKDSLGNVTLSGSLQEQLKSIRNYRFNISITQKYKIPDDINAYVDHNGVAYDYSAIDKNKINNYSIIGFGNIPVGFIDAGLNFFKDRKVAGQVIIKYSNIGSNGHFDSADGARDYTCKFDVTKYLGETYVCGVDTLMPNYSITDCVINNMNGKNSTGVKMDRDDAIEACQPICNALSCPEGTNMGNKDISHDVEERKNKIINENTCDGCDDIAITKKAYQELIEEGICNGTPGGDGPYICPACEEDPGRADCQPGSVGSMLDISWCVEPLLAKGYSLSTARAMCEAVNCPGVDGKTVIYRPIVYDNPFPSITSSTRMPGVNWRSSNDIVDSTGSSEYELVNKYIHGDTINGYGNRGQADNSVYNTRPLYSFKLTPSELRSIRESNINSTYDDFTLDCLVYGRACLSGFVRTYSNDGTCLGVSNYGGFYSCVKGG